MLDTGEHTNVWAEIRQKANLSKESPQQHFKKLALFPVLAVHREKCAACFVKIFQLWRPHSLTLTVTSGGSVILQLGLDWKIKFCTNVKTTVTLLCCGENAFWYSAVKHWCGHCNYTHCSGWMDGSLINWKQTKQHEKYLLIMSSSLPRSACGKAGSSFSSRCCPSPWPGSSVGLTGEFSLDELGDDVWNEMEHLKSSLTYGSDCYNQLLFVHSLLLFTFLISYDINKL